jgi:hypothetical protein
MFRRIRSVIIKQPDVILLKLYVCYVMNPEQVKAQCRYRLYAVSCQLDLSTDTIQTVTTLCFHLFCIHDVAYVQFQQDYIGLSEDGAPDTPKHVASR